MRTPIVVAALVAATGLGASAAAVAVHETDGGSHTTVIRRPAVTVNAAPAATTSPSGGLSAARNAGYPRAEQLLREAEGKAREHSG